MPHVLTFEKKSFKIAHIIVLYLSKSLESFAACRCLQVRLLHTSCAVESEICPVSKEVALRIEEWKVFEVSRQILASKKELRDLMKLDRFL